MTANALRKEAVRSLRQLDGEATMAASRNNDDSGHWDDSTSARMLVRAKDAT